MENPRVPPKRMLTPPKKNKAALLRDSETNRLFSRIPGWHWRGIPSDSLIRSIHIHPRCLNEATPRRKHLLFQLPLLRLEIPPWSDDFFFNGAAMTWGSGTKWKTQDSPAVFLVHVKTAGKRRYPAKCIKTNTNNSNVSWRVLKNSWEFWEDVEAGIFSGNVFWMVLTCFGLKVY